MGLSRLLQPLLHRTPLILLYAAVFATAWFGGSGSALVSVLLTTILAEAFIIPIGDPPNSIWLDAVPLTIFTMIGLATVAILRQLRERTAILREKEGQLTDFMENATVGLHWLAEDGTIIWANSAQASLLGCAVPEYVGRKFQDFHVDAADATESLRRLAGNERLKNFETRLRARDGSIKTVLIDADVLWRDGKFIHARCFI
ncbi:MAG TPA: DUF4118 domain-containing protein, partial [Tepidisphaeraceae bacterium]|nr:DUF4118 domain-containing protein [Tepidisphaeraceae bacterium]